MCDRSGVALGPGSNSRKSKPEVVFGTTILSVAIFARDIFVPGSTSHCAWEYLSVVLANVPRDVVVGDRLGCWMDGCWMGHRGLVCWMHCWIRTDDMGRRRRQLGAEWATAEWATIQEPRSKPLFS